MQENKVNRLYKDRLFRLVFGTKEALLDLYNAVSETGFKNPEDLEITTLDNVIYMNLKNDLSFLILEVLNLYEHQSTFNPNMPVRGLLYFAPLYQKFIDGHKLNLYSSHPLQLPIPRYLVFYNGLKEEPDRVELKLSDLFVKRAGMEPCMELTAVMLNINWGHNRELMERCRVLREYSLFIAEIRDRLGKEIPLEEAVDGAIEYCIREHILAETLLSHRAEVKDVILEEYDQEQHMKSEREEWWEIGKTAGIAAGKAEDVLELLSDVGTIPEVLKQRIKSEEDLTVLKRWLKQAAKVKSVKEFTEGMKPDGEIG